MLYQLEMKNNNNDYHPFDLQMLDTYGNEDLSTLEGIDSFTAKYYDKDGIMDSLMSANFIEEKDKSKELVIVYFENGNFRELKYGPMFYDTSQLINTDFLLEFLKSNLDNPQVLNKIYNEFQKMSNKSLALKHVLEVLRNVRKCENIKNIYYIKFITYFEKRQLSMFILNTFSDILDVENKLEGGNNGARKISRFDKK